MERNLPIQIVETRGAQDAFLKEGGSNNEMPRWATDESIQQNARSIYGSLSEIGRLFDDRSVEEEDRLPILTVATLHEDATAKSYRGNVRAVFDNRQKRNLIGVTAPNKLLIKIDDKIDLQRIERNCRPENIVRASKNKKCGIAAVMQLDLFEPFVDPGIDGEAIKIRLVDYQNSQLNAKAEALFQSKCKDLGISICRQEYTHDLRIFCADGCNQDEIRALATMDSVLSIKRMPYFEISVAPEPENTTVEVKIPVEGETYPLVGLADSGVEPIPHLEPWIDGQEQNVADFEDCGINRAHGTFVAGILCYGDELQGKAWTKCGPVKIRSCIVNTDVDGTRVSEREMVEHIKKAIADNPDIKVWNLSQGSTTEINDYAFSDFAAALDALQKEHNVIICKSAGNIDPNQPDKDRLSLGADSARSLVVASAAHEFTNKGDALEGQRSLFSRIGPGPEFLTKPDLAHYGGNSYSGVSSLAITGFQSNALRGTSFSTPRVASLAANLHHILNRDFDPTLIKALLIHNASYPNTTGKDSSTLLKELGHGIPADLETMLNNNPDEFTMIWSPSLSDADAQIQDIPFPETMVTEDGFYYGDITVTVVTDPILKPSEGSEYCQSDVEVLLQTYDSTEYFVLGAVGTPSTYRNPERLVNPQNVLAKGHYKSQSFKSNDMSERSMIESNLKYQPVKKYHVNLEHMKPAERAKCLSQNRKWCLSVKALHRDSINADMSYDGVVEETKATIIITIRDLRGKGIAYEQCYRSLDAHNFSHSDIIIRQDITIENR